MGLNKCNFHMHHSTQHLHDFFFKFTYNTFLKGDIYCPLIDEDCMWFQKSYFSTQHFPGMMDY